MVTLYGNLRDVRQNKVVWSEMNNMDLMELNKELELNKNCVKK